MALVERRGAHIDRAPQLGGALRELLELLAAAAIAFGRDQLGAPRGGEALALDLDALGGGLARELGRARLLERVGERRRA